MPVCSFEQVPRSGYGLTRTVGSAAFTDVLCVLLPMFVFRGLQVSLRDKLAIFVVFGLGFL